MGGVPSTCGWWRPGLSVMIQCERIMSRESEGIRVRNHGAVTGAVSLAAKGSGDAQEHGHHASPESRIAHKLTHVGALEGTRQTGGGGQRQDGSLRPGASARAATKGRSALVPNAQRSLVFETTLPLMGYSPPPGTGRRLGGGLWDPYTPLPGMVAAEDMSA